MDRLSAWQAYMPRYRFPPFLRWSCGCLGLALVGIGLVIFWLLPGIFSYLLSFEASPTVDVAVGASVNLDAYDLTFLRVERDTRCSEETACPSPGRVGLVFATTGNAEEYVVNYVEGTEFSAFVELPEGYRFRITGMSPPMPGSAARYRAEIEIVDPPPL